MEYAATHDNADIIPQNTRAVPSASSRTGAGNHHPLGTRKCKRLGELPTANVLAPVSVEKTLKGQILIYVWPMDALVIDLHVAQLVQRGIFKPPVAGNRK